jgi:hypothetical protein
MVARTIEIDDVIGVLEDRSRRSQSVFTNAFELRMTVAAFGQGILEMALSAPAGTTLNPKVPVRNTTDTSGLMLFMFITSFPANSRPLLCLTRVHWKIFPQEMLMKKLALNFFIRKWTLFVV